MTQSHVMIDIETMGNRPTSAIMSIGAVVFDPFESTVDISKSLSLKVSLESCMSYGLTVDASTIEWWLRQSEGARDGIITEKWMTHPLLASLDGLSRWMPYGAIVWAHGPSFDLVILENAYRAVKQPCPWSFRSARCTRTIYDLAGVDLKTTGLREGHIDHNALDDAFHQARAVQIAYHRLGIIKAA